MTGEYELDDDATRVDRDALWAFLTGEAYWGRWRERTDVERQLDASWRVVGVYHVPTGAMVGFARAISDGAAYAYLADLYVDTAHRSRGLGRRLVAAMIDDGPGAGFRWALHTADAHALYTPFGFAPPDSTSMERPGRHATAVGPPTITVTDLFTPPPVQWGLRGDPVLWSRLRARGATVPLTRELDVGDLLHTWFRALVGLDLRAPGDEESVYAAEADGGHGMSRGQVHLATWRRRLMPLLLARAAAAQHYTWDTDDGDTDDG